MANTVRGEVPADLVRVRAQFQTWRDSRNLGERIPQKLWDRAVQMARVHGVCRTATALRLDYASLKKRVHPPESQPSTSHASSPAPMFIELPGLPQTTASAECVIELEDGAGASMRVRLKGYDASDLAVLGRTFWESQKCCKSLRK